MDRRPQGITSLTQAPRRRRLQRPRPPYLLTGVLWVSSYLAAATRPRCSGASCLFVVTRASFFLRVGGVYRGGPFSHRLPIQRGPLLLYSSSSSSTNDNNIPQNDEMWVRLDSPPAQRNKEPIWKILENEILSKVSNQEVVDGSDPAAVTVSSDVITPQTPPPPVRVLEIAAGCGVQTQHFCQRMKKAGWKDFVWYPTDPDATSRASIQSYLDEVELADDVMAPLPLRLGAQGIEDVETRNTFVDESLDLIVCINMIHISPWEATVGLMKTSQEKLRPGGFLYCYGPFKVNGKAVESNMAFDRNLRLRDPSWGVRDLEKVQQLALEFGLEFVKSIAMPANNLSLLFRKQEA